MNDSRKAVLRILGSVVFMSGLLLLLAGTRSTGESLETFRVILFPGAASIVGAAAVMLAAADFVFVHFWHRKRTSMKHPWRHA